jgi:tetratricopeptide (TPR) repeat protein
VSTLQGELPDFDALWNYNQPAQSEQAFLAVLHRTAAEAPPAYRLELLTQIARAQGLQRRFDDAQVTLDEVEAGLNDTPETEAVTPHIRYQLERGRIYNSSGEPERARPLFLAAWEQAVASAQDSFAVDAAHMLGIIELREESLAWNRMALARAQASADPRARRWVGSLYNNMGWTYHDAGDYAQALNLFESALAAWETDGQTERVPIARWTVARALRSLGRTQEALARQMGLLEEYERSGRSDGYAHEEIGECLLSLGRWKEAKPHFSEAWSLLSQDAWFVESEPERLERMRQLGASAKRAAP